MTGGWSAPASPTTTTSTAVDGRGERVLEQRDAVELDRRLVGAVHPGGGAAGEHHGADAHGHRSPRSRITTPPWSEGQRPVTGSRSDEPVPVTSPWTTSTRPPSPVRAKTMSMRWSNPERVGVVDPLAEPGGPPRLGLRPLEPGVGEPLPPGDQVVRRPVRPGVADPSPTR